MTHERRIFLTLNADVATGAELVVSPSDAHHLRSVIRSEPGDPILVVDKVTGREFSSFVSSTETPFIVKLGSEVLAERRLGSVRGLLFALCKNKTNDLVAEKAAELGVDYIIFWEGERSVVHLHSEEDRDKKLERLQKIATESSKQAARNSIPEVFVSKNIKQALLVLYDHKTTSDRLFYGSLSAEARPLTQCEPLLGGAHVLIGPEGDISENETRLLIEHGFEAVTLGSNRLRAETAAFAAIAALDVFGQLSKAQKK